MFNKEKKLMTYGVNLKRILSALIITGMVLMPSPIKGEKNIVAVSENAQTAFSDTDGHWAKDDIDFVVSKKIMNGVPDDSFDPERKLTRAELAAIVSRTFRLTAKAENSYSDVTEKDWFSSNIAALKNSNLIPSEMVDGNKINPNAEITREETAALIWNAFYNAYRNEHDVQSGVYSDEGNISAWAKDAVLKLTSVKIVSGDENNNFNPKGTITAAELAAIAHRLRTTDEGYTERITESDGALIEKEMNDAYNRGAVRVIVPPGTYSVPEGTKGVSYRAHILFSRLEDFTFEGYGVNLIFEVTDCAGIEIEYCSNVTLKGLTTDYKTGFGSQGEILDVDYDNAKFTLRIDEGYNNALDDPFYGAQKTGYVFDPDTLKMAEGYANVPFKVEKDTSAKDGRTWICSATNRYGATQLKPGLLLGFRQSASGLGMNTRISSSSGTTIQDHTIHMGQMGLQEQTSNRDVDYVRTHLINVKVIPGPKPEGATRQRLMSTSADAMHFAECEIGPLIENCTIEGNGDDGIAVHGYFKLIMDKYNNELSHIVGDYEDGKAYIIGGMWGNQSARVGDKFIIYDSKGHKKGETKMAKAPIGVTSGDTTQKNNLQIKNPGVMGQQTLYSYSVYQFEDKFDLEYGDLIVNTNMMGNGYHIKDSQVIRNSTRGMLITASDGIIENCTVDGSRGGGIIFLPEIGWAQSGYTDGLTVRNCTLKNIGSSYDVGLAKPTTNSAFKLSSDVEGRTHENIVLDNNRFENNWGYDIELGNVKDIVLKNNVFEPHNEKAAGFKHQECIYAENCENLDVKTCNKAADGRVIFAASECENLKGIVPVSLYPLTVTDNQNGLWRYQYSPLGTNIYYDYEYCEATMEGYTPSFTWWFDTKWNTTYGGVLSYAQVATGSSADVTYTFVAPKDGKIQVTIEDGVRLNPSSTGSDGVKFKILKGNKNLYPKVGWQKVLYGEAGTVDETVTTNVKKGDRIHFRLNCLGNTYYDNVIFSPMVRYLEETTQATTEECNDPESFTNINFEK